MTKEQYKQDILSIESEILNLKEKKMNLREQFLAEHAEFKKGDKVRVFKNHYHRGNADIEFFACEVFIAEANDKYFRGEVDYNFVKVKKDGTPSGQSAGIYSYSRLELIK